MSQDQTQDRQLTHPAERRGAAWLLAAATLLFVAIWLAPAELTSKGITGYAPLHAFAEMFGIVVSMLIFGVAWNAYSSERPGNVLILGVGFLAVGLIGSAYILSRAGMPDLVTPAGREKALNFQLAARMVLAGTLLATALNRSKGITSLAARYLLLTTSVAVTGLVYWVGLYRPDLLPRTFVAGRGFTAGKFAAQYFIIAVLVAAGCVFLQHARRRGPLRLRTADLNQANISLRDGATRIRSILDTVADGIFSIDARGIVKIFNSAAERIFGYAAAEVIGHDVKMLMSEPYRGVIDRSLAGFHGTGQVRVTGKAREVMGKRKDGSTFPMEFSINEMRLGDEHHFTGVVRDITERNIAEDQLRKLSLAVEQSPASILITDLEGRIEYVNTGFVLATGYNREEIIGNNPRFLKSGNTPPETYVALWDALTQGRPWKGELYNRRKDGSEYVESATIAPLYQSDGSISHYVGVKEDITHRMHLAIELDRHRHQLEELVESRTLELVSAKQEADAANHAKSSFLATMSHEIRTPLGGLMGMLELLSMSPLGDEQGEMLQMARDSGRGLLRILNDILDWSRIEEGKLEVAPQVTSIAGLVAEVTATYAQVASGNSIILAHQVDARLAPALMVDPLRLSQVLNNFVSNAIKFSHRGGRVELRAELIARPQGAEEVRFSVKDTGIGIDAEARSRLFQRYGQASADTARMYGGTGLGLAICRRLADLMDGRIDLESEPGRGSTFSITLTLPLAPNEVDPRQGSAAAEASIRPLVDGGAAADAPLAPLVLVVDDHPINRKLLARQLGMLGLRVETAQDGKEALPLWRDGRYALVITDCHMPHLDGYELTYAIRRIEADEARARTPIFAWTANALAEEIERCKAAGMDELLVKPTELVQLKRTLEKWLPTGAQPAPEQIGAPASQAAAAPPPLDLTVLTSMCGGDSAAVRESLRDFRRANDQDALQLRQAVAHDDLERVAHAIHRMLGSSSIVGAEDVARACRHINDASRAGDRVTVAESMQALERELQRLHAYIDFLCES